VSTQSVAATGLLGAFTDADVFEPADLHVARRLTALANDTDESVALAVAFVVKALRAGSVCVDLRSVADQVGRPELPWPAPGTWLAAVRASPLVGKPPVLRIRGKRKTVETHGVRLEFS